MGARSALQNRTEDEPRNNGLRGSFVLMGERLSRAERLLDEMLARRHPTLNLARRN
jgi:hypothetical protein